MSSVLLKTRATLTNLPFSRCISGLAVKNEPILNFKKGSEERIQLEQTLADLKGKCEEIPVVIGGQEFYTGDTVYQTLPHDHSHKLAKYHRADEELIKKAIENALEKRKAWDTTPLSERVNVLMKAADLVSKEWRHRLLAATMLGQGKTIIQAEIDAAAELADFYRFNSMYAMDLQLTQPLDSEDGTNSCYYRGLEGFVAAISPFNFTAIGGNLSATPALMGNVVLWKPSDTAMLANWMVFQLLREAGIPDGVIQFVPAHGPVFGDTVTKSKHLAGINFTGSVKTFKHLWRSVSDNLDVYRTYPRLVGECGGKNYHFVHQSADIESVVNCTIRSAFEYSGQKCSACSRIYVPTSKWPAIRDELLKQHKRIKLGNPEEPSTYLSAVIDEAAFNRVEGYLDKAKASPDVKIIAGGNCDKTKGYFVEPTIIETTNPQHPLMTDELFAPVVTVYPYPDEDYKDVLTLVNETSPYGLTGSLFARDSKVIKEASEILRHSCGNMYINDKSTGSVVGQQPFGGARLSVIAVAGSSTQRRIHYWGYWKKIPYNTYS